jgi:hypothetical protein
MRSTRGRTIVVAASALSLFVLSGCFIVLSTTESFLVDVYARTDRNQRTNEMIFAVGTVWGKARPLTPQGPQAITNHYIGRRYYFSDRRIRRRPLPFLARADDRPYGWSTWEIFAPVEGTNSWVRIEGPASPSDANSLLLTLFNSRQLLAQQSVKTLDWPESRFVRFEEAIASSLTSPNMMLLHTMCCTIPWNYPSKVDTNRHLTSAFAAGREFQSASCAPCSLSAAVAHLG